MANNLIYTSLGEGGIGGTGRIGRFRRYLDQTKEKVHSLICEL